MKLHLVAAAVLFSLPHATLADARAEIRAKCQADVKANCGIVLSRDKALACLIDNAGKLSGGCKSVLQKVSCSDQAPGNIKAAFTYKQ